MYYDSGERRGRGSEYSLVLHGELEDGLQILVPVLRVVRQCSFQLGVSLTKR